MIRSILMVGIAFAVTGCAGITTVCGKGYKNVQLEYGDGYAIVSKEVKIKRERQLRYRLRPDSTSLYGYDYEKAIVEIDGKTASATWLDVDGSWEVDGFLTRCVSPSQALGNYDYTVTIRDHNTSDVIATIDPRVVVER